MKRRIRQVVLIFALASLAGTTLRAQEVSPDYFTFVRVKYSMGDYALGFMMRYGGIESWQVDYPSAEEHLLRALRHTTRLPVAENAVSLSLTDEALFDYAFAYIVEVGFLQMKDEEAKQLREWLLRGGFLMIDDFHGQREWQNFVTEFAKVFPERQIIDIPPSHPLFHCYYDFDSFPQVPGLASLYVGMTYEKGGRIPHCRGIFDDDGRLMVLINHNVDLGDSWEHADDYKYDAKYSRLGYKLGINYIIYALTH